MLHYEEIKNITSPLGQKKLNDTLRDLWNKTTQVNTKDILNGAVIGDKLKEDTIEARHIRANAINADHIEAEQIYGRHIHAGEIDTQHLKALSIKADNIDADAITTKHIKAGSITAESGILADLSVTNAKIQNASINTAHIVDGAITSAKILEGSIGTAHISELKADLLTSGIIDTGAITIRDETGRMIIANNKLQVFDYTNDDIPVLYERIALGHLEGEEYGLVVRGSDGTTILLNEDGITEEGFTDGYSKLPDNSLNPIKIDIDSVITRINEDGTSTIEGSKILLNNKTLDVEIFDINTKQGELETTTSNNTASITANTEAISLKLDSQTFDSYKTETDGEINSINTNLQTKTTEISALQGQIVLKAEQSDLETLETITDGISSNIDTIQTQYSGIVIELDDIESRVLDSETSVSSLDTRVSTSESTILQQADEISQKVNKDGIISEINQTSETIKIQANRILLEGVVTANNNFKILTDGSMEARNAYFEGDVYLRNSSGNINAGMSPSGTTSTSTRIWAGSTYGNRASAPFRVQQNGKMIATDADINGKITSDTGRIGIFEIKPGEIEAKDTTQNWHLRIGAPVAAQIGGGKSPFVLSTLDSGVSLKAMIYPDGSIQTFARLKSDEVLPNGYSGTVGNTSYRYKYIYLENQPNVSSDVRQKNSIQDIPEKLIEKLKDLEPKMFKQNDAEDGLWRFGYIAQDVERVLYKYALEEVGYEDAQEYVKDFAFLHKDESYLSLLYGEIAVLREKEMRDRINNLEERLNNLEGGI